LGAVIGSGEDAIFAKDDIEQPMLAVLDGPMGANDTESLAGWQEG
jgi:hypothetical protein